MHGKRGRREKGGTNDKIVNFRILVERAINRMKNYRILKVTLSTNYHDAT